VSRAVHTPNISTADLQLIVAPLGGGVLGAQVNNKNIKSEELVAYELGYRVAPVKNVSVDVSTFYNDYDRLFFGAPGTPFGPVTTPIGTYGVAPIVPVNAGSAHSYGLETSAKWDPASWAELVAGYTLLELKFDQPDPFGLSFANKSPKQQFNARSSFQLPHDVEFDTSLYYVSPVTALSPSSGLPVPSYYRLDSKLSWKPIESLELSLVGQNLLDNRHPEFAGFLYQSDSQVPRSVYGNITWKF
jgi:iron complex outermembrane receptor protein